MPNQKADLIIHPARLQILAALADKPLTIQELAGMLPDVPKSSIYRHMRALISAGFVEVHQTRPVKGTLEKVYTVLQAPHLSQEDFADLSYDEHLRYFILFLVSQIQEFDRYIRSVPTHNFLEEGAGYSVVVMNLSPEERIQMLTELQQTLLPFARKAPTSESSPHKLAIITHPYTKGESHATG
jgi:DNA-binding transcriptional ArsR family regulator